MVMNATRPKCSYWYKPLSHIHYCLAHQNILWIIAVKYLVSFYFTRAPALGPQQLAWSLWLLGQESDIMFCQWITFRINQQLRHSPPPLPHPRTVQHLTLIIHGNFSLLLSVLSHRTKYILVDIPFSLHSWQKQKANRRKSSIHLGNLYSFCYHFEVRFPFKTVR